MQRRTLPAIVLGLLALGLAGLLWWLVEPGASHGQVLPTAGAGSQRAALSPLDPAPTDEASRPLEPTQGSPLHAQREALELPPELPPGATLELRVVHASPPQPVAEAEVLFAHGPDADGSRTLQAWFRDGLLDSQIDATAIRGQSDGDGRVRIPKPERSAVVVARRGNLWGFRTLEPTTEEPIELALHEDFDLEVEVVDAGGRPRADFPVSLRWRQSRWHQDRILARTDTDGRALLYHAGFRMRSWSLSPEASWVVALVAALERPVEHILDPTAAPTGAIRLVAPATGSLEVSIFDARGEPYIGPVTAGLRLLGGEVARDPAVDLGFERDLVLPESANGRALFEHVEPGRSFEASIARRGSHALHTARGVGPAAPGERARIEVHMGRSTAVLTGRAVDGAGAPLARVQLRSRVDSSTSLDFGQRTVEIPTDDEGRFELDQPLQTTSQGQATLTVYLPGPRGEERLSAARELPPDLRPGLHDLGELTLELPPLLASGVVLDESGEPVAGMWVTPSVRIQWNPEHPDSFYWNELHGQRVRSDERGAFELRARLAPQPIRLAAAGRNLKGEPVEALVGAGALVLRVSGTGSIEGSVRLDPGIPAHHLLARAELQDQGGMGEMAWYQPTRVAEDGTFRVENLRPGTYTLNIQPTSGRFPFGVFRDVLVRAGESTRDPRFDPLDLRGRLHMVRLEIVDSQGQPVREGQVQFRTTSEEKPTQTSIWFQDGRSTLFPSSLPIDVTIQSEGYVDAALLAIDSDQRIVLERGAELRLILRGVSPPEPPFYLGVMLNPVREGTQEFWRHRGHDSGHFDARGEVLVHSPAIGPVSVDFLITYRTGNSSSGTVFRAEPRQVLEVADQAGVQTFEIQVDADAYQMALEGLRKR